MGGLSRYLFVRRIPASLSWEEPKPCWTLIMTHHIRLLLLILAKLWKSKIVKLTLLHVQKHHNWSAAFSRLNSIIHGHSTILFDVCHGWTTVLLQPDKQVCNPRNEENSWSSFFDNLSCQTSRTIPAFEPLMLVSYTKRIYEEVEHKVLWLLTMAPY